MIRLEVGAKVTDDLFLGPRCRVRLGGGCSAAAAVSSEEVLDTVRARWWRGCCGCCSMVDDCIVKEVKDCCGLLMVIMIYTIFSFIRREYVHNAGRGWLRLNWRMRRE